MEFGLFSESGYRRDPVTAQAYDEDVAEIVEGDRLSFAEAWIAETNRVRANNPPDVAGMPSVTLFQQLATQNKLLQLDSFLGSEYTQNYAQAWNSGMSTYFLNSVIVVLPSLALILVISTAASFALEVMLWRGRNGILLIFLAGIMVPTQMVLLPLFTIYFQAGLIDTRWALIITYTVFGLPLSVFLMAGFFKAVPRAIIEAAVLDGANIYQIFYRVAVPMVANGLMTIALVQFFFWWNDLLFALTFISSDSNRTIPTGLLNFAGEFGSVDCGPTFAAVCLAVFPTLILYVVLNQKVIKGLTAGAVKG